MNFLKKLFGNDNSALSTSETKTFVSEDSDENTEAANLVNAVTHEYVETYKDQWERGKITTLKSWKDIDQASDALKINIIIFILKDQTKENLKRRLRDYVDFIDVKNCKYYVLTALLRRKIKYSDDQLFQMLSFALQWNSYDSPIRTVLGVLEKHSINKELSKPVREKLETYLRKLERGQREYSTQERAQLISRISKLLDPDNIDTLPLPRSVWIKQFHKNIPDNNKKLWTELLHYCGTASGGKPSQKWLSGSKPYLDELGLSAFEREVISQLDGFIPDPERTDIGLKNLKGLIWMLSKSKNDAVIQSLSKFAQTCFKKVPGVGARSKLLGNAAITTLANLANNRMAVAELVRLENAIKYPSVKTFLHQKLVDAATKQKVSYDDLVQSSLPDYGLSETGQILIELEGYTATLSVHANGTNIEYQNEQGRVLKSAPSKLSDKNKSALKQLKALAKNIDQSLKGQMAYLEGSYLRNTDFGFSDFVTMYCEHPVRKPFTESLIWMLNDDPDSAFMVSEGKFLSLTSQNLKPTPSDHVKLWHPVFDTPKNILAWRKFIEERKIVQAFKQAHREIYVVTDAELNTNTYSNRFAAHILKQHQFNALSQARQWHYTLQGAWDSWNMPTRDIQAYGLSAGYHVEPAAEDEVTPSYVYLYISTDRVQFYDTGNEAVALADVPPIVFSEIMRDVDLFVAICSVASDPSWADGGPNGRFGAYWENFAFGELGETAKTRKEIVSNLVPRLSMASKLTIGEKSLIVQGKRHEYHIHFGSGNIMIMPQNKYLCIVRAPTKPGSKIYLPFEGDNLTSIIISKALMLLEDDKITDKTILNQLK